MQNVTSQNKFFACDNEEEAASFEDIYIRLRDQEKRLYTDEEVARLPDIDANHIHSKEWRIRKNSVNRLVAYLAKRKEPLKILEIGCGNGWLSHRLSKIKHTEVTGLDINLPELNQAARAFAHLNNLQFIYGDVRQGVLGSEKFDVIVFAASLQYFSSFSATIATALQHLNAGGEVHIIDTIFYRDDEIEQARQRTYDYLRGLGYSAMTNYYFHHSIVQLQKFNSKIMYDPNSFLHKLLRNQNFFHWVRIQSFN